MTESELQAWKQERAQGRDRFILRGMLRRGVRYAATFSVAYFLVVFFRHGKVAAFSELWFILPMFAILVLGVGWCDGASIWYKREREFKRLTGADHVA
jgi:hypothetical protein